MTAPHGYLAQQFGRVLVETRGDESRRQAAARLGVSPNTLRELELGLANPTLKRVEEWASAQGLTAALVFIPTTAKKGKK